MKHSTPFAVAVLAAAALAQEPAPPAAADLPLRKVVIYKNGVGYFERRGTVTGNAVVPLSFDTDQMRDVLKSLFAVDLGGGHVGTIRYESKTPLDQQLDDVLFRVPSEDSLTSLLKQLQGVRVEITVGARTVRGRVLGVQSLPRKVDGDVVTHHRLVLLRDDGAMETLELFDAQNVQILDEDVQHDLARMMQLLAHSRHAGEKTVALQAKGEGERELRVGYVLETPIWKTSYRLLVSDDEAPQIQGWAIAENPTDEDWNQVDLTFVAGSPMTFILDLYSEYQPQRPVLDIGTAAAETGAAPNPPALRGAPASPASRAFFADAAPKEPDSNASLGLGELLKSTMAPATEGAAIGELFAYHATAPVSIEAHQAALVPILLSALPDSERVLYYRADLASVPTHAIKLKNDTDLTLEKGPVTVYQGATLLGESMLPKTLQPGMTTMLSYALEPAVEVESRAESHAQPVTRAILDHGLLRLTRTQVQQMRYTVRNRTDDAHVLYLDHPKPGDGYTLVQPKQAAEERTGHWRFRLELPADGEQVLVVRLEQPIQETIGLANQDLQQIRYYLQQDYLSEGAQNVLQQVAGAMSELAAIDRQQSELRDERKRLIEDQETVRKNIQVLGDSPQERKLRDTYVERLANAVDRTDRIDQQLRDLAQQQQDLQQHIGELLQSFGER